MGNIKEEIVWPLWKKNIVEKFIEFKTFFQIFFTHSFNFFTLASNFLPSISHYLQIKSFFDATNIFGCVEPYSESTFPFKFTIIFQRWQSLEPLVSLLWKIDICVHWVFCTKLNSEQILFEAFLDIMRIFGSIRLAYWKSFLFQSNP